MQSFIESISHTSEQQKVLTPHIVKPLELHECVGEVFLQKVQSLCAENKPLSTTLAFLFQRELMLARSPDPDVVRWVNTLEFENSLCENEAVYSNYVLRKWLSCLPPVFMQFSCLLKVKIVEHGEIPDAEPASQRNLASVRTQITLRRDDFFEPQLLLQKFIAAVVQTIPFFLNSGESLRKSTWLIDKSVFSMQEWWERFSADFDHANLDTRSGLDLQSHLHTLLVTFLLQRIYSGSVEQKSENDTVAKKLIQMLSESSIHSFVA